jgi:hypothetical protein
MDFYLKLPAVSMFREVTKSSSYHNVPEDWWVIITDVVNSTVAFSQGRYKEVNTAGAMAIAAIANQNLHTRVPLVFGGDGITLLCPPEYLEKIKDILHCNRVFVKEGYDLDLRIGLVRVSEIIKAGFPLFVGKFSEVKPFQQAIFWGDGFDYAEKLVKGQDRSYLLPENHIPTHKASYSGFVCPFLDVKSDKGIILSLILKKSTGTADFEKVVNEFFDFLGNEMDYYPITFDNLVPGKSRSELSVMTTLFAGSNKGFKNFIWGILIMVFSRINSLTLNKDKKTWKKVVPLFSDHRKFDGSLKMVVNCTPEEAINLKNWLEKKEKNSEIFYGIHESDSILITCLFSGTYDEREQHLVDGSKGGYTLAAKVLKEKLAKALP